MKLMIPREESLNCIDMKDHYIIQPMFHGEYKAVKKEP